ncbi:hypothetical protein M2271_005539 [Streptomyces sp. LBL]|nr:hypothetical protein [Streptomyces sp. LBL]MDH6627710.1 hypothetical protein [Streptomyces sp. LBL]
MILSVQRQFAAHQQLPGGVRVMWVGKPESLPTIRQFVPQRT